MIKQISPILLAVGLLAACATTPSDKPRGAAKFAEDPRLGEKVDKICFNRSIDGFSQNDRDTVVVREGVNQHYLIEVRGVCSNLRHAQSIGIDSSLSCVTRHDHLIVSTSSFSLNDGITPPDRCTIRAIYEWDEDAEVKNAEEDPSEETAETAAP